MDIDQDRFQRQARRQSVWREESSGVSPFQATDPFTSSPSTKRPKRSDTGISPLEPHPGHRLPSIIDTVARRFSYVAPGTNGEIWSKPFGPTLEKVEETTATQSPSRPTNVASEEAEDPLAQLERAAASGRTSTSFLPRLQPSLPPQSYPASGSFRPSSCFFYSDCSRASLLEDQS
jgi:hypothetical protein